MVSRQHVSPQVTKQNTLEQRGVTNSDNCASRVPLKKSTDWEEPDFEEIDICMEITAYIYHWQ